MSGDVMHRVGLGIDFHRFASGRPLILGGVRIPSDNGLLGHSDADVLLHAICDALLGAAALGDIGVYFPDTDPRFKGADSTELLRAVVEMIEAQGWQVENVDTVVIAEAPKLAPHVPAMRERIAQGLKVSVDRVAVKATTRERMGSLGRSEGMAAQCVALSRRAFP